ASNAGVWDDIIRGAGKTADNVPGSLRGADDIAERLARNPRSRKVAADELGGIMRVPEPQDVARLIDGYLITPSPALREQISRLDPEQLAQVVVLGKGSRQLAETTGDAATTARLLREGGADLAGAVGLHGDEVAKDAIRLDAILRSGDLKVPSGYQKPSLQDFGRMVVNGGESAWMFYTGYVRPNWKEWAAGGALAVYLVNPELFYDVTGKISEKGIELLTRIGGEALAGVLRGAGTGSEEGSRAIKDAFKDYFLQGWKSVPAYLGVIFVLLVVGLFFRRTRKLLLKPFRWLNAE
ncbi:MAG TPA: hypothetical protein PK648_18665, partial [Verrucomicrobiales bacterium]|nr:hypothetical protein [Verrucomicrobiales bacterium]